MSENPTDPDLDPDGAVDDQGAPDQGFTGPDGVDGADDILEEDRERDAEEYADDASDYPSGFGDDDVTAAEQGNRDGDEMVSEGDDAEEVAELAGDTEDVDAVETEPTGEGDGFSVFDDDEDLGLTGDLDQEESGGDPPLS